MSDRLKPQRYNGWRGGLFAGPGLSFAEAGNLRTENATKENLLQADNCVLDEFGSVTGRPGIVAGAASPDYTSEILEFIATNAGGGAANYRFANLANKTIVSEILNVVTVINTYVNGGRGQFICFNGRYVHSNGRDAMQAWLPAAAATANALGAPLSRVLHIHNNRVFCANGDVLYETAPGTGPSDVVDNFATGATWTIRGTSNDTIVGLGSIDRDLYIFKSKTIHIQTGFTVNERQTRQFSPVYGGLSPDSIKTVHLKGIGEAIVFLSHNGKLCAIFGGSVHEIGDAVEAITTTINLEANSYEAAIANAAYKHEARAAVSPYGYYVLGFNNSTGGGLPSLFKQALVLHLDCPYQSQFGTRWPFTIWKDATATEASTFPISFGNLGNDNYIFPPNLACGQVTTTAKKQYFAFTNSNKNDVDQVLPVSDRTFPVRPTIKTFDDNLGSDDIYKNLFEMVIYASTIDGFFSFTYTETTDLGDTPISGDSITSFGAVSQKLTPITADLKNDIRRVSITLVLVFSNQKIHALEIRYTKGASI